MAPAIECTCGYKVETAHEPATNGEMEALIAAAMTHNLVIVNNLAFKINGLGPYQKPNSPTENTDTHEVKFTYHEKTPVEGFEQALIVYEKSR